MIPDVGHFAPKSVRSTIRNAACLHYRIETAYFCAKIWYQLFQDAPILRWDNKEHFAGLPTYPHHYHNEQGLPESSPLQGDPEKDLPVVLTQLGQFLTRLDRLNQKEKL